MKNAMLTSVLTIGVVTGLYVGSYFLCVSQIRVGFTRGDTVWVVPAYWRFPSSGIDPAAFYRPIHLLDEKCLRRSKWQTRPAQNGELSIVGPHRVLFTVPNT